MTCKFDTYQNNKCFHAKHQPYGGVCEPNGCKLKHDSYPAQNKGQDENTPSGGGWFEGKWKDIGIDPFTGEEVK